MADENGQEYTAALDDCISSIAGNFGFFWKTIWMHGNNAGLRNLRRNPNVLMEGDVVFVPPKVPKEAQKATDATHQFVRLGIPSKFRICIMKDKKPRANEQYHLDIDGQHFEGKTDGEGVIDIFIPPHAKEGKLIVGTGADQQRFVLDMGNVKPVTEPSGAIQRLENLGFDCGLNKEKGLAAALKSFQSENEMPATGELDAATQTKLAELHGS